VNVTVVATLAKVVVRARSAFPSITNNGLASTPVTVDPGMRRLIVDRRTNGVAARGLGDSKRTHRGRVVGIQPAGLEKHHFGDVLNFPSNNDVPLNRDEATRRGESNEFVPE